MESFSVLISVYIQERADLLDRALRSILVDQTVKPTEVVLVEDGPLTPELYTVIEEYRQRFSVLVSVKLTQNQGLGKALNAGLKACRNEWIARMDSDDISLPGRFEQQLQYIVTHPDIDVLGCAIDEFTSDENTINATRLCPERVDSYIKFRSPVNHPTAFFRKSSVLKAGGYQHCLFMEDYHLWIRMYALGMKITSMQTSLYRARMDMGTIRRRGGWKYMPSEATIQSLLKRKHIISLPRFCLNMVIRCSARVIPSRLRAYIYKSLLRKPVQATLLPANLYNNTK